MTNVTKTVCFMALLLLAACATGQMTPMTEQQQVIDDLNERALDSAAKGFDSDAQKLLQEALRLASSLDDRAGQAITLLNQSRLARHNNNPQLAAQLVDQALIRANGTPHYADAAQEKALQELAADHLDQAMRWAETARRTEQGSLNGRRLNLLARISLKKNDIGEANNLAEQALTANKDVGLELELANSLRMLGTIKTQTGQWDKAEEMLQGALLLDKQQATPSKIAADLEALAALAALKKETTRQQEYLQRARVIRESSMQHKK